MSGRDDSVICYDILLLCTGERGAVWIILCSTLSFKTTGATGKKLLIFPSKIFLLSDLNGALQFIRFQENQLKTPVPLALQGEVIRDSTEVTWFFNYAKSSII